MNLRKLPLWKKVVLGYCGFVVVELLILMPTMGRRGTEGIGLFLCIFMMFAWPIFFYRIAAKRKIQKIHCPNCKYEGAARVILQAPSPLSWRYGCLSSCPA